MKTLCYFGALLFASIPLFAGNLPVITTQPQSQVVSTNVNATLSVAATGATQYQWRFNGTNIADATTSALVVTNTQLTNTGYYSVLAGNDTGWVSSTLAYLSVVDVTGTVPFSNTGNTNSRAMTWCFNLFQQPITNGTARVVAGPQLDQMNPVGSPVSIFQGYYAGGNPSVPSVVPGQTVYYRVDVISSGPCGYAAQPSTTLVLTAGGTSTGGTVYPIPSVSAIQFPLYPEWPDPSFYVFDDYNPTNKVCLAGETVSFELQFYSSTSSRRIQWRKDGMNIPDATNRVITLTNVQVADVGVYDAIVTGIQPAISPKYFLKLQQANGQGVLKSARLTGGSLICDLEGMQGRKYGVEWSTNLINWASLLTLTNTNGTVTFTNSINSSSKGFYRATLLP
jgi:hypothetical protein